MRVYIGAPIDTARPDTPPGEQFEEIARVVVEAYGADCVIFNPLSAFMNAHRISSKEDMSYLVLVNQSALGAADVGVFVWNGSPSFGVPLEIEHCFNSGKPFVIWNKTGKSLGIYLRQRTLVGKGSIVDSDRELVSALQGLLKKDGKR